MFSHQSQCVCYFCGVVVGGVVFIFCSKKKAVFIVDRESNYSPITISKFFFWISIINNWNITSDESKDVHQALLINIIYNKKP